MDILNDLKVAVLMGGIGSERDISLQSGRCVAEALRQAGLNVITADIRPDELDILHDNSIDVFFPALHGKFGEDGQLQQILEDMSLVYTGSGPKASHLAFDKIQSKRLFTKAGAATPAAIELDEKSDTEQIEKQLRSFVNKYVIKPIHQGSSVGISIVSTHQEAIEIANKTRNEFGDCMIEEFIPGRELTVGIFCDRVLPLIEVQTKGSFYNYHAKYIDERTEYLFDTVTQPSLVAHINQTAIDCFEILGCRHFARVDFILSQDGTPYVLEVNTIPGFTSHSLLPKAAARAGFSMRTFCKMIVNAAHLSPIKQNA